MNFIDKSKKWKAEYALVLARNVKRIYEDEASKWPGGTDRWRLRHEWVRTEYADDTRLAGQEAPMWMSRLIDWDTETQTTDGEGPRYWMVDVRLHDERLGPDDFIEEVVQALNWAKDRLEYCGKARPFAPSCASG